MTKHLINHEIKENYLLVIIKGMEMLLKANFSAENKMGIREIISSLKEMAEYSIRYVINREREKEIMGICEEVSKKVLEYKRMNDNSMALELENLKREVVAVEDLLSSYKGVLDAELVIAEDDIRIIRDKIAISLREDGSCKSMTDADKRARVDVRYERALEDYRVLLRCANTVRAKMSVIGHLNQSINQSISVGRVGMANESYTVKQYEKGKRLSKADALRVLRRAYDLIKNDNYTFMCKVIEKAAVELSLAERSCVACYLIPELKMFKPVNRKNGDFWFHPSKKNIRLHIIDTLIDIYNGNDHPDIVERVARKIRSIF